MGGGSKGGPGVQENRLYQRMTERRNLHRLLDDATFVSHAGVGASNFGQSRIPRQSRCNPRIGNIGLLLDKDPKEDVHKHLPVLMHLSFHIPACSLLLMDNKLATFWCLSSVLAPKLTFDITWGFP